MNKFRKLYLDGDKDLEILTTIKGERNGETLRDKEIAGQWDTYQLALEKGRRRATMQEA